MCKRIVEYLYINSNPCTLTYNFEDAKALDKLYNSNTPDRLNNL